MGKCFEINSIHCECGEKEALPQSAASLYRGLACRGACSQSQAQAGEAPACRRRTESSRTAARLPVPHPLRVGAGALPPGDPAIARSRTGALGFMPFSLTPAYTTATGGDEVIRFWH